MMGHRDDTLHGPDADRRMELAVTWFMRVRAQDAGAEDVFELKQWIDQDPLNAVAYQRVSATWAVVGEAASEPQFASRRQDALDDAQRAARQVERGQRRSWMAAAAGIGVVAIALALSYWTFFAPLRVQAYETAVGERRTLTLQDGSVVTLDARSRMRVAYSGKGRRITLEEGQARFAVAKDPARPFRVEALQQTVVALGTQFNVEIVAGTVLVTLIEGRISVADTAAQGSGSAPLAIEPGQQVVVATAHRAQVRSHVDVERATAWQSGRLIFDNEPLASAVERVNRYAQTQIVVDPAIANLGISGVFNSGATEAFVGAVVAYFPVQLERQDPSVVRLSPRLD